MSRLISALLIAAALGSFDVPSALAESRAWQVLESHGGVRYRLVGERHWWPARTGIEIPDGSSITTGSSGFLIIARDGESITLNTDSHLELQGGPSGETVQQTAGNLRYRITRAPDRRFGVETPYLSLMVKGTVFDVEVSDQGAEIGVTQGRVRIDTPRGQVAELTPGQGARVVTGTGGGLELRADPESPFTAAAPERSIAAAYPREDGDRVPVDAGGQTAGRPDPAHPGGDALATRQSTVRVESARRPVTGPTPRQDAPAATSAATRLALRTAPEGPSEAAETPGGSTTARTPDDGIGSTDRRQRSAPDRAVDQALPGSDSSSGAGGAGVEITADGVGVDSRGPQVAELSPGTPIARSAGAEPEPGVDRGSAVAAASLPTRSNAAAARDAGTGGTDSQQRNPPDQAAVRSDQVSSGGGTGDRVAVALLVLVLLAAVFWWQRQRVRTAPGGTSSDRSKTLIRAGTRRSTTHARL